MSVNLTVTVTLFGGGSLHSKRLCQRREIQQELQLNVSPTYKHGQSIFEYAHSDFRLGLCSVRYLHE